MSTYKKSNLFTLKEHKLLQNFSIKITCLKRKNKQVLTQKKL